MQVSENRGKMKWWKSKEYKQYKRDYTQLPRGFHSFKWVDHPLYTTWHQMKARCYDKNTPNYENYGGRGISVCKKWMFDFERFVYDMGERPDNHSLDRIDNDKGYSKKNCRWASRKTQNRNKRTYVTNNTGHSGITFNGKRYKVRQINTRKTLGRCDTLEEALQLQKEGVPRRKARPESKSGVRGVKKLKSGRFQVRITVNGERQPFYMDTIEEAIELRDFVEEQL